MKRLHGKGFLISIVLLVGVLMLPEVTFSQFISEEGEWVIQISGKRKGTALWSFTAPSGGVSTITGSGFIAGMGKRFVVQEEPGQILRIESDGNILTDPGRPLTIIDTGGNPLGEFTIEHGKANGTFTSLSMAGIFTGAGEAPVGVNLKGRRIPEAIPVLEGNTFKGKVSGGGLASNHFPLNIVEDDALGGYPFFSVNGVGGLKIDGVETPAVDILSDFIVTSQGKIIGDFVSTVLGVGEITGKLIPSKSGPIFKMKVQLNEPERGRFSVSASIHPTVGARLAVTPNDNPVSFGSARIDQTNLVSKEFTLTSIGGLGLTGVATIEGSGSDGFSITNGASYSISPTKSVRMTVQFKPTAAKTYDATIRFTGDETGDILVNIRGTGTQ